jgi:hypothetical protein
VLEFYGMPSSRHDIFFIHSDILNFILFPNKVRSTLLSALIIRFKDRVKFLGWYQ